MVSPSDSIYLHGLILFCPLVALSSSPTLSLWYCIRNDFSVSFHSKPFLCYLLPLPLHVMSFHRPKSLFFYSVVSTLLAFVLLCANMFYFFFWRKNRQGVFTSVGRMCQSYCHHPRPPTNSLSVENPARSFSLSWLIVCLS